MPDDGFPPVIARDPRFLFEYFFEVAARARPVENSYTVSTTAIPITQTQRPRIGLVISNTGSANVAVGFGLDVTITAGILLLPGGAITQRWFYDSELLLRPMYAISAGGGSTLYVVESVLDG